jgi:hypothetical protein
MPDAKEGMRRYGVVITVELHVPEPVTPEQAAQPTLKWMNTMALKSYQQLMRDELQTIDVIVPKAELALHILDPKEKRQSAPAEESK